MLTFDNIILLLDDPEALEAALESLAETWSHREGVKIEHFKVMHHLLSLITTM